MLKGGGVAAAGLTVLQVAGPAHAFPDDGEDRGAGEVVPWLDQPAPSPAPASALRNLLVWEELDSWYTPADDFFVVNHYDEPALAAQDYRLRIGGLVERQESLTLADLRDRPRREVDYTLECSGNTGLDFFIGGIGNARWAGTPLAPLLRRARVLEEGREVVFWGADAGQVTVRDNSGVVSGGRTGTTTADGTDGLDLTVTERFARSMTVREASSPDTCCATR